MTSLRSSGGETVVPDSTTSLDMGDFCLFSPGEDVLLKQRDGRFYLGTVVEMDVLSEQCLVKFGDNTESWSLLKDLTKLASNLQENLLCVICKKSAPKREREIFVCDKCGRGYHQKCHQPSIPPECQKEDSKWMCRRCVSCEPHRLKKTDLKHHRRESLKNSIGTTSASTERKFLTPSKRVLPYDLHSLSWDTYHRVNSEHSYCYCGENGEWYKQMLQCGRCKQWFHERCLDCFQYPLYCGDRFYVFVCSICNHGKEFLRRLEMKWVDLVHLMLFNLTAYNSKKYYDLDMIVIPYINDNWHALQLPPKIESVSPSERRDNILSVLTNNRNRFKCGREIKKRTTIWGLRVRLPPPAPSVTLVSTGLITDEELKEVWQGNRRLQFLPHSPGGGVAIDNEMRSLMMGVAYQQGSNLSESDSDIEKAEKILPLTPPTSISAPPTPPASGSNSLFSETPVNDTSGDETSSKSTLDLIIPPPKDFEGKNNPFLALLRGSDERPVKRKKSITLPLPLTAVIPGKPRMRKRQLSEKDIVVGPNGEVKRRRFRRGRTIYPTTQTASKTATIHPVSNSEYGRRLRARPEKTTPDKAPPPPPPPPPKPSPVKTEPDINIIDLKSSVNIYFGAANRIAAGERFTLKAKRVGPTGKLEYLIEWEGP